MQGAYLILLLMTEIERIIAKQRTFFETGTTLDVHYRHAMLACFSKVIEDSIKDIDSALYSDLRKHSMESLMTETGMVLDELKYVASHLHKWVEVRKVRTPLAQFPSRSFVVPEPYGNVLIMSPWNYPFQLSLEPVIGAVAAGNTVVVKPSAYSPATSHLIAEVVKKAFPEELVAVVEGGREENAALLEQKWDYIFFTGSPAVGKIVMEKAAAHLTPVSLELGGKSPVIIDKSANIKVAAKRVAFGKVLNAGQTCVAPDYVLIHKDVKEAFVENYLKAVEEFFPNGYDSMPVIVNKKHFERVCSLVEETLEGGARLRTVRGSDWQRDEKSRFAEPAVLTEVTWDSAIMQEEIFGPVLPVLVFEKEDRAIEEVRRRPRPLALYLFTSDRKFRKKVLESVSFGGGCVNDTIIHLATPYMPFGGVGNSGMGSYHGKASFDTFTHYKSIVSKSCAIDLPMRYHPYTERKLKTIRKFMG